MLSLKPYPEYRPSDSPWLGDVPVGWRLLKTKYLFSERVQKGFPDEPLLAATQTKGVIPKSLFENRTVVATKDLHLLKLVQVGDYVISLRSFEGGIEYAHYRGIISPAYTVLEPSEPAQRDYFEFLFKSRPFIDALTLFVTGIREGQNIDYERLSRAPLPVPPLEEQVVIGRFLRSVIGKTNRLIQAKRREIELLNEQKQAIIHRAVTRGLDSQVRFKPFAAPSVAEVPIHWAELALGRAITRIDQGWSPVAAEGGISNHQWAVLTLSSVRRGFFDVSALKPIPLALDVPYNLEVHEDDFLLTRSNTRDRVGDCCVVKNVRPKTIMSDLIYRLALRLEMLLPDFLAYQLLSPFGRHQIERDARGSSGTMPKISQSHIKSWRILAPSVEEQRLICQKIGEETSSLAAFSARAENEIDLLREYRTRLIADVVTGKLDVRGVDLPDTEDAEPMEPLSESEETEEGDGPVDEEMEVVE